MGDYCWIILRPCWDQFGIMLGSFWDHFGIMLGSFWDHFGITLGSFLDHFGIILRSFWNHPTHTKQKQNSFRFTPGGQGVLRFARSLAETEKTETKQRPFQARQGGGSRPLRQAPCTKQKKSLTKHGRQKLSNYFASATQWR